MTHLSVVPENPDLRAEELMFDADGVTVAVEKVDGVLKVRVQDGPEGEPAMFDLHSVTPMFLDWIVKAERATAHRQEHDGDWALWDAIGHMLTRLFPDRHPEAF